MRNLLIQSIYIYINIYRILKKLRRLHNLFKIARISQFVGNGEIFQNLRQLYIYIYMCSKLRRFRNLLEMAKSSKICDNYIYIYVFKIAKISQSVGKLRNLPKIAKIQNCEDYILIYIYINAICSKLRRFRNKLRKLNIYAICSKLRRFRNLLKIAMISQNLKYIFLYINQLYLKYTSCFLQKIYIQFLEIGYIYYIFILIWNIYLY